MNCPKCGHENAADAKFCSECGTSLTIACPVCATVADPGDRFCRNCGAALDGEKPDEPAKEDLSRYLPDELLAKMRSARAGHAMLGERRTVTMLFADVTGSTAAAERFDPEDWVEIMNGAFEHLIAPIYRYEGMLAQLRGDAVLAFFGAPIAHEDDPVRALRAGLEMLDAIQTYSGEVEERWGIPLQIRVGVNTGLVVVGEIGSDLRVEYTALGDAINVAARMEQTAEPGTIRVTEETLSRTGGQFATEQIGPVEVKGKAQPVMSHRVLRYVGGTPVGLQGPIVGRGEELESLDNVVARLVGGSGWIATVIADAGIGKTRLLREWTTRTEKAHEVASRYDQPGDIFWLSIASRSYDTSDPLSTIRGLLGSFWGAGNSRPEFDTVSDAAGKAGVNDDDQAALLGYLGGAVLSPSAESYIGALETPVLNARARDSFIAYLTGLTEERPVVVVFEDLHWADHVSLALIEQVMGIAESRPLGLLAAMRPYREEPAWRVHEVAERNHHHRYQAYELAPLTPEEGALLLDSLAGQEPLANDEKRAILERSDGNPLFIEEIAKSLAEVDADSLPTSLSATLTARLDRLDDETKYMVQVASVLGTEFDRSTLDVVLGTVAQSSQIVELLRRGIFVESPDRAGAVHFRHALFQEAAYGTILRRTRRDLHARVADHLIEVSPDSSLQIAAHLVDAGDEQRAFPFLVDAGLKASRSMSLAEAIRLLTTALDNIPESVDPELVVNAHDALGEAYSLVPDLTHASSAYQKLYEFGENEGRPTARVTALNRLGWTTASLAADLDGATRYLEEARALAEECGDEMGLAEYHMTSCFVASMAGNPLTALEHDERTVEIGEKSGMDLIRISGMVRRATNYIALLDFERGLPAVTQGLTETKDAGQEEAYSIVESFGVGIERMLRGDLASAQEIMERSERTLERYSSFYRAINLRNLGVMLHEQGDLEGALARFVDCRRVGERKHQPFIAATGSSGAALMYAELGYPEPIAELRAEAMASFDGPMADFMASTIWADLAWTSLLQGAGGRAREEFDAGLGVSSTTQYVERPRLLCGLALAALGTGDLATAESSVGKAHEIVEEKDLAIYRALVHSTRARLLSENGNQEGADAELVLAQRNAMDIGQPLSIIGILRARARLAAARGDGDESAQLDAQASKAADMVASSIIDETLRAAFVENERNRAAVG